MTDIPKALVSSVSQEWMTPGWILEKARLTLDGIDLDPASTPEANKEVRAASIFTISDDGLSQPWHGKVWCNPPYGKIGGKSSQGLWAQKMIREHMACRVEGGLLLTTARTADLWFRALWDYSVCLCFFYRRIAFVGPSGAQQKSPSQAHVLALFSRDDDVMGRFKHEFGPRGKVWCYRDDS